MKNFFRMATVAGTLALALLANAAIASSLVITGPTSSLANTCNGTNDMLVDTVSNIPASGSDNYTITAPSFGGYTWTTGENGPFSGPFSGYNFGYPNEIGLNVPAGTSVTATISVYSGLNVTGVVLYTSAITWNCTTGEVLSIVNRDLNSKVIASVPALSAPMMVALSALIAAFGVFVMRRRVG